MDEETIMVVVAFDLETHLISGPTPPTPVCISWYGHPTKKSGVLSTTEGEKDGVLLVARSLFKEAIAGKIELVGQNVCFDLRVLYWYYDELKHLILKAMTLGVIHDTRIRERLYKLSTLGTVEGKFSLDKLVMDHLHIDISDTKKGDVWRLKYKELEGKRATEYPKAAFDYALMDSKLTLDVYNAQEKIRQESGPGSMNTEARQVRAQFVLEEMTTEGIKFDPERVNKLYQEQYNALIPLQREYVQRGFGLYTKVGQFRKQDKKFREYLQENYPDKIKWSKPSPKLKRSNILVDDKSLGEFPEDKIISLRRKMTSIEKTLSTYLKKFKDREIAHWSYDFLKETGRTSGFIQLIPKEGGLRECFMDEDNYLISIDYAALELCTVAQSMYETFGVSALRTYLNSGDKPIDIHAVMGTYLYAFDIGEKPDFKAFCRFKETNPEIYKKYRTMGKAPGLSYFGGVGADTLTRIAQAQGVHMTHDQALLAKEAHGKAFPERLYYLGQRGFIHTMAVSPSQYGYSSDGRYRNKCTYCACANGFSMQSRASDGAKEALWKLFTKIEGDKIPVKMCGFIHDEVLFKISRNTSGKVIAETLDKLAGLMIDGMQIMTPDVRVTVEACVFDRWTKDESKALYSLKKWKDAINVNN